MNLGVTLNAAEKAFGPALPGRGTEDATLSAVRYAGGGAKKFAGVPGILENARFYLHFPTAIDWHLLKSKKGVPDFVNNLSESGPQGQQGREALVREFLERSAEVRAKLQAKKAAADKKAAIALSKQRLVALRPRLLQHVGETAATITIGNETFSLPVKITKDKTGKIKIIASV